MPQETPHFDVLIIGAGLSGIGAAYHVQHDCPGKSYAILEGRAAMGGTWDLFRYPGIRSDSDMYTLGFSFHPWKDPQAIADGPAILEYIHDTAATFGIDQHIRYHHKVVHANWSSADNHWILDIAPHADVPYARMTCDFLFTCCGYYNYEQGHAPTFPSSDDFQGKIIHPQHWDTELDYTDQRIVVIGSGATAVTLVPELAKKAASVTMLQRSPTYIVNLPREDGVANALKRILPRQWAHHLIRWKNILFSLGFYKACRAWPRVMRRLIQKGIRKEVGNTVDMQHFDPRYNPWDQRLCMVPDGDLFESLKSGQAEIVTDTIERFTPTGIALTSGQHLDADLIVTATGLQIQLLGGMQLALDGEPVDLAQTHSYKGVLFSGIPNFAVAIGYTNASWTLKCDLNASFVTRVLRQMDRTGAQTVTPEFDPGQFATEPLLDFDAGYIKRAQHILPKQGSAAPWKVYQNYLRDLWALRWASVRDRYLRYR